MGIASRSGGRATVMPTARMAPMRIQPTAVKRLAIAPAWSFPRVFCSGKEAADGPGCENLFRSARVSSLTTQQAHPLSTLCCHMMCWGQPCALISQASKWRASQTEHRKYPFSTKRFLSCSVHILWLSILEFRVILMLHTLCFPDVVLKLFSRAGTMV